MSTWAYDEATKRARVSVPGYGRECQRIDYDSRRTGDWFSDRGSIPLRSTKSTVYDGTFLISRESKWPKPGIRCAASGEEIADL